MGTLVAWSVIKVFKSAVLITFARGNAFMGLLGVFKMESTGQLADDSRDGLVSGMSPDLLKMDEALVNFERYGNSSVVNTKQFFPQSLTTSTLHMCVRVFKLALALEILMALTTMQPPPLVLPSLTSVTASSLTRRNLNL